MALLDMSDGVLARVAPTSFEAESIYERRHLQAAIRDNISLLGDDLLVVAEEFGDFSDSNRRIDLLCIDRDGRPVVVELKRTSNGGHMELQALRYAAMVSALTFDQLLGTFEAYLGRVSPDDVAQARDRLEDWLSDVGGPDAVIEREVRIILASGDFGREITTTALWLNEVFGTDIRCVRMIPYRIDDRLLLDIQQVVPLPEAQDLTVQLRRRQAAIRDSDGVSRDRTRFVVSSRSGSSEPLPKRKAVLAMVQAVSEAGASVDAMADALGRSRFMSVQGRLSGEPLVEAFVAAHPNARGNEHRWFFDSPLHRSELTWVLSNQWGTNTEGALERLAKLVHGSNVAYMAV